MRRMHDALLMPRNGEIYVGRGTWSIELPHLTGLTVSIFDGTVEHRVGGECRFSPPRDPELFTSIPPRSLGSWLLRRCA